MPIFKKWEKEKEKLLRKIKSKREKNPWKYSGQSKGEISKMRAQAILSD